MYSFSHSRGLSEQNKTLYTSETINRYNKNYGSDFNLLKIKTKKEININLAKFHTNVLFRKFNLYTKPKINYKIKGINNSSLSLFLTKVETDHQIKTTSTIDSSKQKLFEKTINLKKYTTQCLSDNNLEIEKYKKPYSFNELISECLEQGKNNIDTISNFINKSRVIRKFKINKEIQKNKLLELKENELLKNEKIENILYKQRLAKNYLENYINTLHDYLLYLYTIINKEKEVISNLLIKKNELQLDIIQIFSKIEKKEKILEKNKQYKIFLLLVKFNVKDLTLISEEDLKKYGIQISNKEKENITNKLLSPQKSRIKNREKLTSKKLISLKNLGKTRKKRSSVFETENLIFEQEIDPSSNPKIFQSVDEFFFRLQFLDNTLRDLIENFNYVKMEKEELNEEKNKVENILIDNKNSDIRIINSMKNQLTKLKEKNSFLQNKKFFIKNNNNHIKYISHNIIFSKLKNIILKYPINIEKDLNIINFYENINSKSKQILDKGKYYNKNIFCLKILETLLLKYSSLIKIYSSNPKEYPLYENIVHELEEKKKYEKNEKNKYKEIKRRELISKKVIEKNKKIIITSRRKIDKFDSLMKIQRQIEKEELERIRKLNKIDEGKYAPWISY